MAEAHLSVSKERINQAAEDLSKALDKLRALGMVGYSPGRETLTLLANVQNFFNSARRVDNV